MTATSTDIPQTLQWIEQGIDQGMHLGAQLCVFRGGQNNIDTVVGQQRPGIAMSRDTLLPWMSCTKAITAIAVARQIEAGMLELDQPVADVLLDFGQNGKQVITLRHILTHTGGFRLARYRFPGDSWSTIIERICAADIERDWVPGEKAGYHVSSSWFILGELVRVVTGERFGDHVKQHILEPLGMTDCYLSMPHDVYDSMGDRIGPMYDTRKDSTIQHDWTARPRLTACSPGSTGVGPMNQLIRLYRMLHSTGENDPTGSLDGVTILSPETVGMVTKPQRVGMYDHTFKATIDMGLGLIRDSKHHGQIQVPYGYGLHASPNTFGHSGSQSSVAFADSTHDFCVALCFNGAPGEMRHNDRVHQTLSLLYEDLGLG